MKRDMIKNRLSLDQAQSAYREFIQGDNIMVLAYGQGDDLIADHVHYRYIEGKLLALLPQGQKVYEPLKGLVIEPKVGLARKATLNLSFEVIDQDHDLVKALVRKEGPKVRHMVAHGNQVLLLELVNGVYHHGFRQVYTINDNHDLDGLGKKPNGQQMYDHSRLLVMAYEDRESVMNVICHHGVYETLTHKTYKKLEIFMKNPTCKIYDGKDNHFETTVEVVDDPRAVEDLFKALEATHNNYFKASKDLVLLRFRR